MPRESRYLLQHSMSMTDAQSRYFQLIKMATAIIRNYTVVFLYHAAAAAFIITGDSRLRVFCIHV